MMKAAWFGNRAVEHRLAKLGWYYQKVEECVCACAQDGRDLLHACVRGGNEDLVKWFLQEFNPRMTLTKVCIWNIWMCNFSGNH